VVFTGLLDDRSPGEYPHLVVDRSGGGEFRRGKPPELGREVAFRELPAGCRGRVMAVYRELWSL
jgi:hypothetical protein